MANELTVSLSARGLLPSKTPVGGLEVERLEERSAPRLREDLAAKDASKLATESVSPSQEELVATVEFLNQRAQDIRRELRFELDEASGRTVIHVVDAETDEVIRDIPPEEVRTVAAHFDQLQGGLLKEKA